MLSNKLKMAFRAVSMFVAQGLIVSGLAYAAPESGYHALSPSSRFWDEEPARSAQSGGTAIGSFRNSVAFREISTVIGRDLFDPPDAYLQEGVNGIARAKAVTGEIRQHVDAAELAMSKTRRDVLLAGYELDELTYNGYEDAYYLPLYRAGVKTFYYRYHVDRGGEDADMVIPLSAGRSVYVELKVVEGNGLKRRWSEILSTPSAGQISKFVDGLEDRRYLSYFDKYGNPPYESDKEIRNKNISRVMNTLERKRVAVVLGCGTIDQSVLGDFENIILVDLNEKALRRAWDGLPRDMQRKTYLVQADVSWLTAPLIALMREIEDSPMEFKDAVRTIIRTLENERTSVFPDNFADLIITERTYYDLENSLLDYVLNCLKDKYPYEMRKERMRKLVTDKLRLVVKPVQLGEWHRILSTGGAIYLSVLDGLRELLTVRYVPIIETWDPLFEAAEKYGFFDNSWELSTVSWQWTERDEFVIPWRVRGFWFRKDEMPLVQRNNGGGNINRNLNGTSNTITAETEQVHAIDFIRQAKRKDVPAFIALGTDWIKGYEKDSHLQYDALNPLITSLRGFCRERGIEFICDDDETIGYLVEGIKHKSPTARGIVLAGVDLIKALEAENNADIFMAGVDDRYLIANSYIRLMEMLTLTLELFHARLANRSIDQETIADEHPELGIRFLTDGSIIFIPEAELMDYEDLRGLYTFQTFA
ncbi:MAG: hypothetical protein ABIH74_01750 [Candidatus Omnitrophota bacterium]